MHRLVRHAADGPVDGGVQARCRDGHVLGSIGVADGDGGSCLVAGMGVEQHQFAVGIVPDRFVDCLQVGQVLGPVVGGIVLALPGFVSQSVIKDRAWLVGRRNVVSVRPVRMLILQGIGCGLGSLRLVQLAVERQAVVVVAIDSRHTVMVTDRMVSLVERVLLLGRELRPQIVKLLGIIRQRPRQCLEDIGACLRQARRGGIATSGGDGLSQTGVGVIGGNK